MILSNLILSSKINQRWVTSGIDSIDRCLNKQHFLEYPHSVEYQYNSRGFRDAEWPNTIEELQNAIWCVGDSFTVGIGSPHEFTWPQVLSRATGRRCINVSMDGASNNWISRRAQQIIKEIAPNHMVVLWSYGHRREILDPNLSDEAKKLHYEKSGLESVSKLNDITNFINCYVSLKNSRAGTIIFNGIIPNSGVVEEIIEHITRSWNNIKDISWPDAFPSTLTEFDQLPDHVKKESSSLFSQSDFEAWFLLNNFYSQNQLLHLSNLDYARDYHHFDLATSNFFVQKILENFSN
jgi:hypothetical protein